MVLDANIERLDHLGVIAGVIKDLGLVELIDQRISKDVREDISTGEAVAGMIINGLGFSDRPISLTPQFFENKALEKLFRPGVSAKHFNRFKLGRALDECHAYGCDQLFAEVSLHICRCEGIDTRFNALDTTAFSLTGEYDCDSDEHTIEITHGYSKDHRPDLKQVVLELMCTHDGGIPVISKSWNGNASDSKVFRQRAKALVDGLNSADSPRYLIADSKLYDQETVRTYLTNIPFITRIPGTVKLENETVRQALQQPVESWSLLDDKSRYLCFEQVHYSLQQRWIVVWSMDAQGRAEKRIHKQCEIQKSLLEGKLKKIYGREFACKEDALRSLDACTKDSRYYKAVCEGIKEIKRYDSKGRPKADKIAKIRYRIKGKLEENNTTIKEAIDQSSCYVIGTSIAPEELSERDVVLAYKNQNNTVEKGFRFLKDPVMFTSSLFVKKPSRIMGLLMVMTLALLVYAVAQRRLRRALQATQTTIPNQIKKEVNTPTLRWAFQILEGVEILTIKTQEGMQTVVTGLNDLKKRILSHFGSAVQKIYELENQPAQAGPGP